jgi:sterol desaturase/sphingolipid hydroxylase (fatty acid hydroxylase superfamily)
MSAREFLSNVTITLTVMALASLLETAVPMFVGRTWTHGRRAANLGLTTLVFSLNWLLASAAALGALALSARPVGLMTRLNLPVFAQVAAGVVLLDFSTGYVAHRPMHVWPAMWRFDRIHPSDEFVDVTTMYRTHPVESVWRFLFAIAPVWAIGIPAQAVVIQRLMQATNGVAETNSNYGNVLSLYDRLLGTFTPAERESSVVYGLNDVDPANVLPYTKVRFSSSLSR